MKLIVALPQNRNFASPTMGFIFRHIRSLCPSEDTAMTCTHICLVEARKQSTEQAGDKLLPTDISFTVSVSHRVHLAESCINFMRKYTDEMRRQYVR